MDGFSFLQIEPTKDEKVIKKAYSKLLPVYHPEKDHEGFMKLRQAYEEALKYARQEQKEKPLKTPVDLWMEKVEDIYFHMEKRIDVKEWERLLEEDVCVALDSSNECNERLLIFLAEHLFVPHEVLAVLEKFFQWSYKKEKLYQKFPSSYIDYLCANAHYPDNFRYGLIDFSDGIDYDRVLEEYYHLERLLQGEDRQAVQESLTKLEQFHVKHPDILHARIRAYRYLDNKVMTKALCEELLSKKEPDESDLHCLAQSFLDLGQYKTAISYYDIILDKKPDSVGALIGKAACYKALEQYEDAVTVAKRAQEISPYDGYIRNFVVMLYEDLLPLYRERFEQDKNDIGNAYRFCKALAEAYHFEEAVEVLPYVSESQMDEYDYCNLCVRAYMDMENRNCEKAIPYLQRMIVLKPEILANYEDLGYCYGEQDRLEEAKEIYAKAKTIDKTSPRIYYRLAQIYIKEKKYQDAIDICNIGLRYNDQLPNLYHFKAEAYYHLKNYERALELCDQAIALLPYVDTYEMKARMLNECEQYEEVISILEPLVKVGFMSDLLYVELALAKRKTHCFDEAEKILESLIEKETKVSDAYFQWSILLIYRKKYEESKEYCKKAIDMSRECKVEYLMLLTQIALRLRKAQEVVPYYERYDKEGALTDALAISLGDIYFDWKKYHKSIEYYKKALQYNAYNENVHGRLADAYLEMQLNEEALEEVNKQLAIAPSDYYYIDRGILYNKQHRKDLAILDYEKALELNPENCYAYHNLAYIYLEAGELREALNCFLKAIEWQHPMLTNYYQAAVLYKRLGQFADAKNLLQEGLKLNPNQFQLQLEYVKTLIDMEQYENVQGQLVRLHEQYPDEEQVLDNLLIQAYKRQHKYADIPPIYKSAIRKNRKDAENYRGLAGFYMDYLRDYKRALRYYKKAYERDKRDAYVCSRLGMLYEQKKKEKLSRYYYQEALRLDLKTMKNNEHLSCVYDCIGMDYAWLKQYDKSVPYFYRAIIYGSCCDTCSMAECYEVWYDIADAFERKASYLKKGELSGKEENTKLQLWISKTIKEIEQDVVPKIDGVQILWNEERKNDLLIYLKDYLAADSYETCMKLSYKYYKKALRMRPWKVKYQYAVRRMKEVLTQI